MTYNAINRNTVTKEAGVVGYDKKMLTYAIPDNLQVSSSGGAKAESYYRGLVLGDSSTAGDQAALEGMGQKGNPLNWEGADLVKMEYLFSFPNSSIPKTDDDIVIGVCDENDASRNSPVMGYDAADDKFRVGSNTARPGNIYDAYNHLTFLKIEADYRKEETRFTVKRGGNVLKSTINAVKAGAGRSGIASYRSNGNSQRVYIQMFGMTIIHE